MNDTTWRKAGGAAGILFALLVTGAFLSMGDSPDFADDSKTISAFFIDNEGKLFGTAVLAMLAAFALAWFSNGLREAMRGDEGGAPSRGGGLVVTGGAIASASYAIAGAIMAVGAERVSANGAEGAASSFINWDLFMVTFGAAAPVGLAVLLSGAAVFALRGGTFLPAWLGWVSVLLAVIGLIPPISFMLTIGMAIWSIIVGVLLLRRSAA